MTSGQQDIQISGQLAAKPFDGLHRDIVNLAGLGFMKCALVDQGIDFTRGQGLLIRVAFPILTDRNAT